MFMNVGNASSLTNGLAQLASSMKSQDLQNNVSMAVLKQVLDTQELQMEMILKLIESSPSPDPAVGRNVNISA